jgi:hypothetical protein
MGKGEKTSMRIEKEYEYEYDADGRCHVWHCSQPGIVLASDPFSPEIALWFCEDHLDADVLGMYTILEDKRVEPEVEPEAQDYFGLRQQALTEIDEECARERQRIRRSAFLA